MTPEFVFILIVWSLVGWSTLASGWNSARKYVMHDGDMPTLRQLGRMVLVQLACGPAVWLLFFGIACRVIFGMVLYDWRLYRARQFLTDKRSVFYWLNQQLQQCDREQIASRPVTPLSEDVVTLLPERLQPLWSASVKSAFYPSEENVKAFNELCRPADMVIGLQALMYVHLMGQAQRAVCGKDPIDPPTTSYPEGTP